MIVEFKWASATIRKLNSFPKITPRAMKRALYDIGKDMYSEARRLIKEGPKSGTKYKVRGRTHTASAPGQAPANWTGKLRRSVGFNVRPNEVEYGYRIDYGKYLEEGTSKMSPRPGLRLTYRNKRKNIRGYFERRLKEQFERKI